MSAAPSATWQNFIADPLAVRAIGPSEVQKSIGRRIEMRAADAATAPSRGQAPRADRRLVGAVLQQPKPLGLHADNAAPNSASRRRGDDAGDWHAAGNDGEIDGKFITAGQKLLGAVERVDDQKASSTRLALPSADSSEITGNARQ